MNTTDKEQIQILKDWWKKNSSAVLMALLVFAITNYGWRYFQQHKNKIAAKTSLGYTQMLTAVEQKKTDEAVLMGKKLIQEQPKSVYAGMAGLTLAKIYVQKQDLKAAQTQLEFVINKTSDSAFKQIAKVRLARVLLELKQPQKALDILATVSDVAYNAEIKEISADALLALGKNAEAKKAYQEAANSSDSPLLKLKMQQF